MIVSNRALSAGLTFLSSVPPPSTVVGQVLTWNLGADLIAGASGSIVIQVLPDVDTPLFTNLATISTSSAEGGGGTANNYDFCSSDLNLRTCLFW